VRSDEVTGDGPSRASGTDGLGVKSDESDE
jgi:hypothetical protein